MRTQRREHSAPAAEDVLEGALVKLKDVGSSYGLYILAGVAVLVIALIVLHSYQSKARRDEAKVWQELGQMPPLSRRDLQPASDEDLQQIIGQCQRLLKESWKTNATAWVLLKVANAERAAGRFEDALKSYEQLQRDYPEHYATRLAAASHAGVLEETGRHKEAAAAYEQLAGRRVQDAHFWLDAGRSWELAGEKDAAMQAYRRLVESAGGSPSEASELAVARVSELARGEALLAVPPPPPVEQKAPKSGKSQEQGEPGPAQPAAVATEPPQEGKAPAASQEDGSSHPPATESSGNPPEGG